MTVLVEAAVESLVDALAAVDGGADRLELCANLAVGGTSPDPALVTAVVANVDVPVCVMVRPRAGSFVHTRGEVERMRGEIGRARDLGAAGVVFGAITVHRLLDARAAELLMADASDLAVTFHRAFDALRDPLDAIDALIELGVQRVLTSGGAPTAEQGSDALRELVDHAGDELVVLAGGGVRGHNVQEIVERSGVREVHARCGADAERIRALKSALADA